MKIYIHHYFTEHLFYFLAHNTVEREFNISDQLGSVNCKYKNTPIELIFKLDLSDESDGYHLLDWTTIHSQLSIDEKLKPLTESNRNVSIEINNSENNTLYNLAELLKDKSNWILTFFSGEKSLYKYESLVYHKNVELLYDLENSLNKLDNFKIIFEEAFLKQEIEIKYPNFYYAFTNTMWYWNNHADIKFYDEFSDIFSNLNFKYDLCYSVRAHKYNRILLLNELKKLNQPKLFLQRSDGRKDGEEYSKYSHLVSDIHLNSTLGINDFDNLDLINKQRLGMDLFFRVLPKAKMQLLDESWSWSKNNFASHYISEKSIGLILSKIPFISTHSYPLEILEKILNIRPHPFLEESKKIQSDSKMIAEFVDKFLNDFENNYNLCKMWSDECYNKFVKKLKTENSLLDLIIGGFIKEKQLSKLL